MSDQIVNIVMGGLLILFVAVGASVMILKALGVLSSKSDDEANYV